MKVLLLTYGSRGDVEPFIALAAALGGSGPEAILGAPLGLASMEPPAGMSVVQLPHRTSSLGADPRMREAVGIGLWRHRHKRRGWRATRGLRRVTTRGYDDPVAASHEGVDVVHSVLYPGHQIAERLRVPAVAGGPRPGWVPSGAFTHPQLPVALPRRLNQASYRIADARRWAHQGNLTHGCRRPDPVWRPPVALTRLLEAGDPPVYIGFGSMVGADPAGSGDLVAAAIRRAGVRAVVTGGGGTSATNLGDDVCSVSGAPLGWLFPRMAAVVHHGGKLAGRAARLGRLIRAEDGVAEAARVVVAVTRRHESGR